MATENMDIDLELTPAQRAELFAYIDRVQTVMSDPAARQQLVNELLPVAKMKDRIPELIKLELALTVKAMFLQNDIVKLEEANAAEEARQQAGKAALEVLKREVRPLVAALSGAVA